MCLLLFTVTSFIHAQTSTDFDYKKAYELAKAKGIADSDIDGYVKFLYHDFLSHTSIANKKSNQGSVLNMGTIYLGGGNIAQAASPNPPSPQNAYCPNAGFEQYNFTGWTGGYGAVATAATGAPFPTYNQTSATIVNPAGNNVGLTNTQNYHTIMTTPATNSVHPGVLGYDSIASRVVGTQTVSEVPVVNPNGGPASVRMNGAVANYRACKLNYNMALNPNNKNFSVSYALVLENGSHTANDQPYFSVRITDQNGTLVPGCSQYTITCSSNVVNPAHPSYDPMWAVSAYSGFDQILYRKWQTFAFDFSNYPAITSVNVEFYVGGCGQSGHFGYAYVDAQCSQGGAVASFCAGSNTSVLTAPAGYSTYQWIGPSGPVATVNGGNTGTATITPVTAGQVYTCNVTAPNGCASSFQTTVAITTVSVTGISSTPSCLNGNSGLANVSATGSSLGYSYQWLNSSGATVSSVQNATGLAPGNYTVVVSSPMCGSSTATISVGITPPQFYSLPAPFCGSVAWITRAGGSNYKWYTANPLALIPGANSSSLTINSPVAGAQYFLSYTTANGCKDSIRYTLNQTTGGSINFTNIKSICAGNNNGHAIVNLQTTSPGPFSYTVTGPSSYSSVTSNTTAIKDSVINLSIGTYTANVFDGQCVYTNTFAVQPFVFTYTLTPQNPVICNTGSTNLQVEFCNASVPSCGLAASTSNCSGTPNIKQVGNGSVTNSNTSMPCVFGNFYKNNRHQLLYTAAELIAAGITPGKLNSIAFEVLSMQPLQTPTSSSSSVYSNIPFNYTVKMKCTSATVLTTAFDNAGLQQVFNGNLTPSIGWNTFNFNQAYEWDGTSSILIDICYNMQTYYTSNPIMTSTGVGANRCVYYQSDSQVACNTTATGTTSQNRPNIRFWNVQSINPNNFTYTWAPTTGLSSTTSFSTVANPTVTTIYTVTVNPINQTNCAQVQTSTVSIIVPNTPTLSSVNPICTNASALTLTATPSAGTWSGSGVNSAGIFTPSLALVGTNNYTYTIGSGTCSATNTIAISVEQFVPSTITGNFTSPICLTSPNFNLLSIVSNTTGIWSGNGVSGNQFSPALSGVGTHSLVYSTNSLPTSSLCPSSSSISVTVNDAITPTVTPAGPFCDNFAPQNLNASPSGGVWSAVTVGSIVSPQGQFMPNSSLIGTNTLLYSVTNGACSGTVALNVNVSQFTAATLTGNLGPYCVYEPIKNLQSVALNAGGIWSGNGVLGTTFSPTLAGPGTHTLVYNTDSNPSGLCPDQSQLVVVVNDKPEINTLSSIYEGCKPLQVNLYSSNINTGNAQWNVGDGTPIINGININHTYNTSGTYFATVTYTNAAGCIDTTIISTAIVVHEVPDANFTATPEITTLIDAEVTFNNQTPNSNDYTYEWDFAGLGNTSQVNPIFTFTTSGDYFITMIATSIEGCKDTAVRKITIKPDVVIYVPNAFTVNGDGLNDEFKIFIPPTGIDISTFEITIFDRWGKQLFKSNDVAISWKGSVNNSGEVVKQDVYVWKITFQDERKRYYEKTGQVLLLKNMKN